MSSFLLSFTLFHSAHLILVLHSEEYNFECVTSAVHGHDSPGFCVQVMILSQDKERGRISLSTKKLEPTPGDMLRNPALVFEKVFVA